MNRIALIGCGDIAETGHVPALLRHPRFTIAAVCDIRPERAKLLAERAGGVPAYADWRELLDRERVEAVVLALPPECSPDIAIGCLQRGLPVLDEKPLAATLEDGRRVARAVAESGGVYQVGFVLRYGDWVQEVGRLTRAIGVPARMHVSIYDERLDPANTEHLNRIGGFLWHSSAMTHEGSHVIDYAALWNPSPWTTVRAIARKTAPTMRGPNLWHSVVELSDGSWLEVNIGWLLPEVPPSAVVIEGPNGWLALNPVTGVGRCRVAGEEKALALPPMAQEWARQYDIFAAAIERREPVAATVEDGLRALEVTAACEQSARMGTTIARSEFLST